MTGQGNLVTAGKSLLAMGPRFAVIKKGEHGAMLTTSDSVTVIPAFATEDVRDPTGAGDSFAGGMLGYLDQCSQSDTATLRRALVRGTVAASFHHRGLLAKPSAVSDTRGGGKPRQAVRRNAARSSDRSLHRPEVRVQAPLDEPAR